MKKRYSRIWNRIEGRWQSLATALFFVQVGRFCEGVVWASLCPAERQVLFAVPWGGGSAVWLGILLRRIAWIGLESLCAAYAVGVPLCLGMGIGRIVWGASCRRAAVWPGTLGGALLRLVMPLLTYLAEVLYEDGLFRQGAAFWRRQWRERWAPMTAYETRRRALRFVGERLARSWFLFLLWAVELLLWQDTA